MSQTVAIGRVIKPHGIRGEVVVNVLSDVDGRLNAGDEILLDGKLTRIAGSRPHQGRLLLRFDHIPDRTAAETLRGALLEGEQADVSEEDNFYAHELVGCRVFAPDGTDLGEVADIILMPEAAGYDLLEVVRTDEAGVEHRWLLPAADELVEAVEYEDGTIGLEVLELPEGLLDTSQADAVRSPGETAPQQAAPVEVDEP